jgi:hypothetical protein
VQQLVVVEPGWQLGVSDRSLDKLDREPGGPQNLERLGLQESVEPPEPTGEILTI